jgi:SAM-dependent methyltransferase
VKYFIILLIQFLLISSCSTHIARRTISSLEVKEELSCKKAFDNFAIRILSPKRRANRFLSQRKESKLPIHLDLGGEGRYKDAINVNPNAYTSTTGEWGRVIPFWVEGRSDNIPFPSLSVDKITVENAPLSQEALKEMLRVLRPRGDIHLSHPVEYAEQAHQMIINAFPGAKITQEVVDTNTVTKISFKNKLDN